MWSGVEGKKVGDETERWMLARDRSGHVRQHPFSRFFPHPHFASLLSRIRAAQHLLFASIPVIFLVSGRHVFSHMTRLFSGFSDHLLFELL